MSSNIFIIAEAGVNHNGDLKSALKMVEAAHQIGADAVKFQTFRAEEIASNDTPLAQYQNSNTTGFQSQYEMLRSLELNYEDLDRVAKLCSELGIEFMSTAFDIVSLDLLLDIGIKRIKIPSGEITNLPLLEYCGGRGLPILLSTGMSDLDEVSSAVKVLTNAGADEYDITIMQCNTAYPTPINDANIRVLNTYKETFNGLVGYSDHTHGSEAILASVALGARVIEKHFTLDRSLPGPDQASSMEVPEFHTLVAQVRRVEKALGATSKFLTSSEKANRDVARRSIVALKDISKGEKLTDKNISCKRPGTGISPMKWRQVLGAVASRDYKADELIIEHVD